MSSIPPLQGVIRAVALVIMLVFVPAPVAGQDAPERTDDRSDALRNPLASLRNRAAASAPAGSLAPLEGPVDPDTYVVGPGDVFALTVSAGSGTTASIPVSADGMLLLPDAASVHVAGLRLTEARERAMASLLRSYGRTVVDLVLAQPRRFYVHVSGAVPTPGRYLAEPVARVSSVLEVAFADSARSSLKNPAYRPSLRNITLIHRDGEETSIDLARYFATGDVDSNPYLTDGDVIVVPGYDPSFQAVWVDGAVPFPGAYDFRAGDTARDLLVVAGMREIPAHVSTVRITRTDINGVSETRELPIDSVMVGSTADQVLQELDHVSVTPDHPAGGSVVVDGWVRSPGTYRIESGLSTVKDVVRMAGGLREGALLASAYIERRGESMNEKPVNTAEAFSRVRADTLRAIRAMRLTGLDFQSRLYFQQDFERNRRVSVDLGTALDPDADAVLLRDGDRLVVPRDEQTVLVFGQVVRPGYVPYSAGRKPESYVQAAGGAGLLAGTVVHLRAGSDEAVTDPLAEVNSGDVIFVDRKEDVAETEGGQNLVLAAQEVALSRQQVELARLQLDLQERTQKREMRFRVFQSVLGTISTVGTFVALYLSIQRQSP